MNKIILISVLLISANYAESTDKVPDSPSSFNTASSYSRICNEDDLYGLWHAVRWIPYHEVRGEEWERAAYMKHQWFLFDGKGGMKSLCSNLDITLEEVRKKLHDAPDNIKISIDKEGIMSIKYNGSEDVSERWRCSLAEKDIKIKKMDITIKKDDIIMTQLDKNNTIVYFRLMRRVDEK